MTNALDVFIRHQTRSHDTQRRRSAVAVGLGAGADAPLSQVEALGLTPAQARRLQLCCQLARAIEREGADQPAPIDQPGMQVGTAAEKSGTLRQSARALVSV